MDIKDIYIRNPSIRAGVSVVARVGDDRFLKYRFCVKDSATAEAVDLTGCVVKFEGLNPKCEFTDVGCETTDPVRGIFDFEFTNQILAVSGKFKTAYFSITKNGQRTTTANIRLEVLQRADLTCKQVGYYVSALDKLIAKYKNDYAAVDIQLIAVRKKLEEMQDIIDTWEGFDPTNLDELLRQKVGYGLNYTEAGLISVDAETVVRDYINASGEIPTKDWVNSRIDDETLIQEELLRAWIILESAGG